MLLEEERTPAEYIIFNIYEDTHRWTLDAWRNIRVSRHPQHIEATLPHVKVDMAHARIIECGNPCPTPESVYDLCDLDKIHEMFRDDFVLRILIAHRNSEIKNMDTGYKYPAELIKTHGIETRLDKSRTPDQNVAEIHWKAALFSTGKIIEKVDEFARSRGKKVLFVLSFPGSSVARFISEGKRTDLEFLSFLRERNLPYVDLLEAEEILYEYEPAENGTNPMWCHSNASHPGEVQQVLIPLWNGSPMFKSHSYRSFSVEGLQNEMILFQNEGDDHVPWSFRDGNGKWTATGLWE